MAQGLSFLSVVRTERTMLKIRSEAGFGGTRKGRFWKLRVQIGWVEFPKLVGTGETIEVKLIKDGEYSWMNQSQVVEVGVG